MGNGTGGMGNGTGGGGDGGGDGGGSTVIIIAVIIGAIVIIGVIAVMVKLRRKSTKVAQVGAAQPQPATNPATNMPVMAVPVPSMPAEVTPQPSGAMFDPNTGQPIPKFDPVTGAQNW